MQQATDGYTVRVLIDQWSDHHLSQRSASYRKHVPARMRRTLAKWLDAPARSLTHADAVSVLDGVKSGSGLIAANRQRAEARSCWGWALKRGTLTTNPWQATPRPARENQRERVLSDAELRELWAASGALGEPWAAILRLLILTGQRLGEVAGMAWSEIDLTAGLWTLPANRTKNGRSHTVPLSAPALDILRQVKRWRGAELVFAGPRGTAPSGFGKVKLRLDAAMGDAARAAEREMHPWTIHDIRRTVATGLQRLGVRLEVTEAVLNHVSGSRSGIVGVYQRHGWDREKTEALSGWAGHVLACVEAPIIEGGSVAPLPLTA